MLDWPGLGVSHRGSTTFVSTSIYFRSASWPRIGRPRKSPGWTFSFGSSAWDVEPQWIGPSWGFASREHGISFHSDLYSPSGSWPRMPRIVALPASPPFCTEGLGFIPMALILTGFRQNHKTQAIPTSVPVAWYEAGFDPF